MPADKRKHGDLSSTSDLEASINNPAEESIPAGDKEKDKKSKSQKKKESKKPKTGSDENEKGKQEGMAKRTNMQDDISEINKKLSQIITKDDNSFMKQVIKDVFLENSFMKDMIKEIFIEIKDTLLESLKLKIETIEGDLHDTAVENKNLKAEIQKLSKQVQEKNENIQVLERNNEREKVNFSNRLNEQEQYTRRNNIRISTLPDDSPKESSAETSQKVITFIKTKMGVNVSPADIDIAHRLGKYESPRTNRSVIVKFVRRQTKIDVMTNKKKLKVLEGPKVYVSEDLTKMNNEVLASTRKKQTDEVERSWSIDGKIFIKWKADSAIEKLKIADYQKWLDLPWP